MQALTIRDVKLLQQSNTKITQLQLTHATHKSRSCYEISFTIIAKDIQTPTTLITTRNQPYRLADLNRAITFICELFPGTSKIDLHIRQNKQGCSPLT